MKLMHIHSNQWKQVKDIYLNAFPKAERKPFFMLKNAKNDISGTMEIMNFGGTISIEEYLDLQKYALGPLLFRISKQKCFTTH